MAGERFQGPRFPKFMGAEIMGVKLGDRRARVRCLHAVAVG